MKEFQSLLFSSKLNIQTIKTNINELKNKFSVNEIDFQIILTFSLNYEKIPVLLALLSEPKIEEKFLIHNDQILIFHLLKNNNNISIPLSIVFKDKDNDYIKNKALILEKSLYEELQKQNKLDLLKEEIKKKNKGEITIKIREKEKIEEIIEKDDIESFRLISNDTNFELKGKIKKENK